jgi:hypothetical protein
MHTLMLSFANKGICRHSARLATRKKQRMNVSKTIETPQGTIKFEGELEEKEADLVIKIGLNVLMQAGTLKLLAVEDKPEEDGTLQ